MYLQCICLFSALLDLIIQNLNRSNIMIPGLYYESSMQNSNKFIFKVHIPS